jgi:phosphatidylinositol 4-kinase
LVAQLSPYILEAHTQAFVPSPFFREIEPSPVEALSYHLATALLALGVNHDYLKEIISEKLCGYVKHCSDAAESATQGLGSDGGNSSEVEDAVQVATIAISILGFLHAAATYANFWTASERLTLLERVRSILSEGFLVAVETAFSTIRNSHSQNSHVKEWKRFVRHYAAIGRPLGAMLLQRSFMWLLLAGSSLLIADISSLKGNDILEVLMSGIGRPPTVCGEVDFATIETMADMAADEMSLLEDGADYLRLGSAWQQRLAFSVKAGALTSYLNCALFNEDAADVDPLMSWLEDTLADPIQMADETLASVVLRSMALICKLSPTFAPNISRLLPRFIVQGAPRGQTLAVASTCLAYVLQMLSQDAIITTLYTLGNVLSSGASTERALVGGINGDVSMDGSVNSTFYTGKHSTGSAISLAISDEEETSVVYGNVVQAICGIANSCNDDKITALAQSMLLQKIDKVSRTIDARIITEAAGLALRGGPLEFRSLLKLYAKLSNDGVTQNNEVLLSAVSFRVNVISE